MYSDVICIGDSYTNEIEFYKQHGFWEKFDEAGYEFKSYPQLLGEHFNCRWETFGKPGLGMVDSFNKLLEIIPYILSKQKPLVIYQFGFFTNLQIRVNDTKLSWKDLEEWGMCKVGTADASISMGTKFEGMDNIDKLALTTFTDKFGESVNYHFIEHIKTLSNTLKVINPNVELYGIFVSSPDFKTPQDSDAIINCNDRFLRINHYVPSVDDSHKSTEDNKLILNHILAKINAK